MQDALVALFTRTFGRPPAQLTRLTPDGSQRTYFRMAGAESATVIGAASPDPDENRAFLSFSRTFRALGLPVPEILAADEGRGVWLEEDLGDTTLFQALAGAREAGPGEFPPALLQVYEEVVDLLPRFQVEGGRAIDFSVAYPRAAFDRQSMHWDLNYFKYHFLKLAHVPFNEQRLENDFHRLIAHLLTADSGYFLYRDFQSRNVMLRGGRPWFIDYQGGRRGAAQYDVASLLYDAKADVPEDVRAHLLARYVAALGRQAGVDAGRFLETYRSFVLIRIMQALGAYGYRGFFERKPRFLESVPYAARNLAGLLEVGLPVALPELEGAFRAIVEAWAGRQGPLGPLAGLTVRLTSFSYAQGLPPDDSGHGGGYVFDCRALPNPGRCPEFAGTSGRDPAVAAFLEAAPETASFWSHVLALVEAHLANFRDRRFSGLSVAFGCTGGQHRSVYFVERLARHLRERHPDVSVRVEHAAEARWPASAGAPPESAPAPGAPRRAAIPAGEDPWTR
jgi:aminoglycoside/choline kinase family phosphotransferase